MGVASNYKRENMGGAASTLSHEAQCKTRQPTAASSGVAVTDDFATHFSERLYKNHISYVLGEKKGKDAFQLFLNREYPDANYEVFSYTLCIVLSNS